MREADLEMTKVVTGEKRVNPNLRNYIIDWFEFWLILNGKDQFCFEMLFKQS